MKEEDRKNLRRELAKWEVHLESDPLTPQHVLNRIASEQPPAARSQQFSRLVTFLMVTGIAAIVIIGTMFIRETRTHTRMLQTNEYQVIIDPVTRANLHKEDVHNDRLLEQLAWMQDRLNLSQEQFLQMVDLHRNYSETFNEFYQELVSLEAEYDNFEALRQNNEMVDFIALYDVLNSRKQTEVRAHRLSMELISRVTSILNPNQKTAYLSLIKPDLKPNA